MKQQVEITFELNGSQVCFEAEPHERLLDILRAELQHTGTKEACGEGECGACTVIVDGRAVNSCLYPVVEVDGRKVTTVEGLAETAGNLGPLQQAFVEAGAVQCGFCTPGMLLSAKALLDVNPTPTRSDILEAITGNLCRCTGYVQIVDAIEKAALVNRGGARG